MTFVNSINIAMDNGVAFLTLFSLLNGQPITAVTSFVMTHSMLEKLQRGIVDSIEQHSLKAKNIIPFPPKVGA